MNHKEIKIIKKTNGYLVRITQCVQCQEYVYRSLAVALRKISFELDSSIKSSIVLGDDPDSLYSREMAIVAAAVEQK